ncbi:MAG: molybdenum ABC transporter ATP-binding protein [Alphaproteobacteria bacterium]
MIDIDVRKYLGDFRVDAKIEADSSGVIALFGRSGSGKTTLVNMIAGLIRPDAGRIVIDGETLFNSEKQINLAPERRRLGYVFQEDRLFPHMSVAANLRYGMKRYNSKAQFHHIVDILGVQHLLDRQPTHLSGGEKQRVSIGRALLADPQLLLMDEPLASLDSSRKDEILPFIEELSSELNIPIIYVSHAMDEIIRLADMLVLMSDGEIAAVGSVEELTSRLDLRPMTGRYEAGSVINVVISKHDEAEGFTHLTFSGGTFLVPRIELPPGRKFRIRIRARDVSLALDNPQKISINNVFPGVIKELGTGSGDLIDVLIDAGAPIWARVSRSSVSRLELRPGKQVFTMIKAVAIDRYSLGGVGREKATS